MQKLQQSYRRDIYETLQILNSSHSGNHLNERVARLEAQNIALLQDIAKFTKQNNQDFLDDLKQSNDQMFTKILTILNTMDTAITALSSRISTLESHGDESKIDYAVSNPRVRLFSLEDYKGYNAEYDFGLNGTCHTLKSMKGRVRSVDTNGKCVRLFLQEDCVGWSAAIYPGSGNSQKVLNSKLTGVISVGPCLKDEFRGAKVVKTISGEHIVKDSGNFRNYFPDLVEFDSWKLYYQGVVLDDSDLTPMKGYLVGDGGRLEFVSAFVNARHLNLSRIDTGAITNSTYWEAMDKQEGDVVGFAIPLLIGGPANETFNAFSQTVESAAEWKERTAFIPECMKTHPGADLWISVVFMFPNEHTKRPHVFTYRIRCALKVYYGIVRN